jgi:hypothetical protein
MKDFSEWLLLERQLDQAMRSAAGKTFDAIEAELLKLVKTTAKSFAEFLPKAYMGNLNMQSHDTAAVILADMMPTMGSKMKIYSEKYGSNLSMQMQIPMSMVTIPSVITPEMMKAAGFGSAPNPMRLFIAGIGKGGTAGTYVSSRSTKRTSGNATFILTDEGSVLINLYSFVPFKFKKDSVLYKAINDALTAKVKGEGKGNIGKAMEPWVKSFERELRAVRSTFVHEFIHFLDDMRYSKPTPGNISKGITVSSDTTDTEKKAYYTSDAEWNAYYQAAAEQIEDALSSYLVAATSDRAAKYVSTIRNTRFNTMLPSGKCAEVAKLVVDDFNERIEEVTKDGRIVRLLTDFGLQSTPFKGLHRFCLAYIVANADKTSKFFLAEPEKRMKLLNRITSLVDDIRKVVASYQQRMGAGQAPTAQEHAAALRKFKLAEGQPLERSAYRAMIASSTMLKHKRFDPSKEY